LAVHQLHGLHGELAPTTLFTAPPVEDEEWPSTYARYLTHFDQVWATARPI
jgi:hypothetical protein